MMAFTTPPTTLPRGMYWLKTDKYTYVIPNYCKANLAGMQWWLYLTVGGQTKISVDSARTLHVIDDEGKDHALSKLLAFGWFMSWLQWLLVPDFLQLARLQVRIACAVFRRVGIPSAARFRTSQRHRRLCSIYFPP